MKLSDDQKRAANTIISWYFSENKKPYITLGGYAGTGKSTLIAVIKAYINHKSQNKLKVAFCSYTGRAAQNLKNKLKTNKSLKSKDTISTIHGLIYDPIENDKGVIIGWSKKEEIEKDLIIVDEASMVDEQIWHDLLSYKIPVIAVGDHGQLPPIQGTFNLMQKPDLKLEQIFRQTKGNPIIDVSIYARNNGKIPCKQFGTNVVKYSTTDSDFHSASTDLLESYDENMLILCGYNTTRNKINQFIRNSLGFELQEPQVGDRVICLRNNNKKGIYNGMLGKILDINYTTPEWYEVTIEMDDQKSKYQGKIYAPQFGATEPINFTKNRLKASDGDLFDFGYALTVHKAQGSQAKKVVLFEERFKQMDDEQWKKWLYTGVTRAEKELYIFGTDYDAEL